MNKWILLIGTIFMTFVFAYCIPITIKLPSTSNIIVTAVSGIIMIIGFWIFMNAGRKKEKVIVNNQEMTPID